MTDVEIMTAMERCFEENTCAGCILEDNLLTGCTVTLGIEALKLLRRQKQELEELRTSKQNPERGNKE